MATNLALDDKLIEETVELGGFKTKKAAVTQALQEYIQRHKQAQIVQLFGTIDYDEDYNHRQGRSRFKRQRQPSWIIGVRIFFNQG